MGHWGLVLGVRCPSWTSPMPTVILKCQIRLFHDLNNAGYILGIFAVGFGTTISCLDRNGQQLDPTNDILKPKRLFCMDLIMLKWLSTCRNTKNTVRVKNAPSRCRGWTTFWQSGEACLVYLRGMRRINAIQSPKLVDWDLRKDSRYLLDIRISMHSGTGTNAGPQSNYGTCKWVSTGHATRRDTHGRLARRQARNQRRARVLSRQFYCRGHSAVYNLLPENEIIPVRQ